MSLKGLGSNYIYATCFSQNYNNIRKKMLNKIKIEFPILRQCSQAKSVEFQNQRVFLQSQVRIRPNQNIKHKLKLFQNDIVLEAKSEEGKCLFSMELEFWLKLERIQKINNFGKLKFQGFKLINEYAEEISFFFDSHKEARKWIRILSKLITQTSFTQKFKPLRILGRGSSGTVFEVQRLEDRQIFAAKVFQKSILTHSQRRMSCFVNEVQILRNVDHSNLVDFEGVFESEDSFQVIMEHLEGGNLLTMLSQRRQRLSVREIRELLRGVLSGLEYLHRSQIVHRDLKLENILLRERGGLSAVIADFGLAVYADDEDYFFYQCGTPGYVAPECFSLKSGEALTPIADIFSLGVIMHVLATGKFLFQGSSIKQLMASNLALEFDLLRTEYQALDRDLFDLMSKMLQKDSKKRCSAEECLNHTFFQPLLPQKRESQEFESNKTLDFTLSECCSQNL